MAEQENKADFAAALKYAIIQSLSGKGLITRAEKTALEQKNLSSK